MGNNDSLRSFVFDIFFGLVSLFAIYFLLSRLWGGGFTGGDDGATASANWLAGNSYWQASFNIASSQGRFYQLLIYPWAQIPYIGDSLNWFNICRIASSGFAICTFYLFSRVTFGKSIGYLALFIYLAFFESIGGGYNPFHTLPFWFNAGMGWIFLSLTFFVIWLSRDSASLLLISMLSFILGLLTYESMIFYLLAFPLLVIFKFAAHQTNNIKFISLKNALFISCRLPFLIVLLYLILYLIFRSRYPSTYMGNSVTLSSISEFTESLIALSLSGIRLAYGPLASNMPLNTWDWRVVLMTLGLSTGVISIILFQKRDVFIVTPLLYFLTLLGVSFFIFSPNFLLVLTEKYRYFALHSPEPFYIGSYYSAFAAALFLSYALLGIYQLHLSLFVFNSLRILTVVLLLPHFILITYENNLVSSQFFLLSKDEAIRWKYMNKVSEHILKHYPMVKNICTDSLIEAPDPNHYWTYFFSKKIGRHVDLIYVKPENSIDSCDAYIKYHRYDSYLEVGDRRIKISG